MRFAVPDAVRYSEAPGGQYKLYARPAAENTKLQVEKHCAVSTIQSKGKKLAPLLDLRAIEHHLPRSSDCCLCTSNCADEELRSAKQATDIWILYVHSASVTVVRA